MIRQATLADNARLVSLLCEMRDKSKFAPDIDVDMPTARSLLATGLQRNGFTNIGGAIVLVVEVCGKIEGFILGMLDRVYHIGNRLVANDIYLYVTDAAPRTAAMRLCRGYVDWAVGNPKVAKIMLSWTDALGVDGKKLAYLYKRLGFRKVGEIWERDGA